MTPYEQRWLRQLEIKAAEHHVDIIRLWRRGSLMPQDYPGYPFGEAIIQPTSFTTLTSFTTGTYPTTSTETTLTPTTATAPPCDNLDGNPVSSSYSIRWDITESRMHFSAPGYPISPPIVFDCVSASVSISQTAKYSYTQPSSGLQWIVYEFSMPGSVSIGPVLTVEAIGPVLRILSPVPDDFGNCPEPQICLSRSFRFDWGEGSQTFDPSWDNVIRYPCHNSGAALGTLNPSGASVDYGGTSPFIGFNGDSFGGVTNFSRRLLCDGSPLPKTSGGFFYIFNGVRVRATVL